MPVNNEDFAILIGIDKYIFFDPLKGVQDDVAKLQKWLLDENGGSIPGKNIRTVLSPPNPDPDDPQPIQERVNKELRGMGVLKGRRIGRRLYFYFSGHGYGQVDDVGMLMANASELELNQNIGLRHYRNFLLDWGFFDEVIFILDCCRDPIRHAETKNPSFTFPPELKPDINRKVKHATILACEYGEKSFMIPMKAGDPEKRGVLTQAFLEGLADHLATDISGDITIASMMDYLSKRVPELAGVHERDQTPEFFTPIPIKNIVLLSGIQKKQIISVFLPQEVTQLIITNSLAEKIAEFSLNAGAWVFSYLTQDAAKQKYVTRISESAAPPETGNGTLIKVELIQNCWYDLECSNGVSDILDLRKVHTSKADFIFKFD